MRTVIGVLTLSLLLVCGTTANGITISTFPIYESATQKYFPAVSGNNVGWRDDSIGGIYVYNLISHTLTPVGSSPTNIGTSSSSELGPNMGGTYVVWEEGSSIYTYNTATNSTAIVGQNNGGFSGTAKTDGAKVVWQNNANLNGYNLPSGPSFTTLPNGHQFRPDVDGDVVVWQDDRIDGSTRDDVFGYRFSTGNEFPIHTGAGGQGRPSVSGNFVVWQEDVDYNATYKGIYAYDLLTNTEFVLASTALAGRREFPAISGNTVVWMDSRNGDFDIYGYNLLTMQEFPIYVGPGEQRYPTIDGNMVVWSDSRNGNYDIYGATISETSNAVPEPATFALFGLSLLTLWRRRR